MFRDEDKSQDLTVRGEAIERVYEHYRSKRYVVNRRYQRKLIWAHEEKVNFIDSILRGFPVPIILLAENKSASGNQLEIIDGMQRLNAITSFVDNDYSINGNFFDLNTTAITKKLLDSGEISQRHPALSRDECVRIASYQLPFSIYEFSNKVHVDEVFRRINSGGRKLSRQELRAAGATGHFAQVVRTIAEQVRGDSSHSDTLLLNDMKYISITNRELDYGIPVDEIFWVKHGILEKDQVRQSRDEELIADIVAYMVSDDPVSSIVEFIDEYYGVGNDTLLGERFSQIELAVQRRTAQLTVSDFIKVIDEIELTMSSVDQTFGSVLFESKPARAPRYFQAVFLAFYELIILQSKEVKDRAALVKAMRNSGSAIDIQEGGRWGADQRARSINTVIGLCQNAFGPAQIRDPAITHWISKLQNILSQSSTEQSAYDFKQGFLKLRHEAEFDKQSFEKILKTCVGISNLRKGQRGYVIVGVAENDQVANRFKEIRGEMPRKYNSFHIVGVEAEARAMGKTLDQMFQLIVDKIKKSQISEQLRDFLARNIHLVRYFEKTVLVLEIEAQEDPSTFAGHYFVRHGNQLIEIDQTRIPSFIRRYDQGS